MRKQNWPTGFSTTRLRRRNPTPATSVAHRHGQAEHAGVGGTVTTGRGQLERCAVASGDITIAAALPLRAERPIKARYIRSTVAEEETNDYPC